MCWYCNAMHYNTTRAHERRKRAIAILGGVCVKCGSVERLEIHHKNPKEKSFDVSRNITNAWESIAAELKKCELLCNSCHKKEHVGSHGLNGYRNWKCRCDICTSVWNEKSKEYKRRYRDKKKALLLSSEHDKSP